ncbi:MAG: DUF3419 family protein [Syntrophothermus sp.]
MKNFLNKILKFEFEYRIFFSLSIVLLTCFLSFTFYAESLSIIQLMIPGNPQIVLSLSFILLALYLIPVSLLRMWAGNLLSSERVMSFKIVNDLLVVKGPYKLTRNPIYFSDIAAICGFTFCLPLPGVIMPFLFYIHYKLLIKYEEKILSDNFKQSYSAFLKSAPRLFPSFKSISKFLKDEKKFFINIDGFKNNSLYILFIPGFIAAAISGSFLTAILIGTPGVLYWAIVHTRKGTRKTTNVDAESKVFSKVLYAQCWEDPDIDREAFNIKNDDVVFSITSGGCNTLSFLIDDPLKLIALDLNSNQNHMLELKIAAIRNLSYYECLEFLGVLPSKKRLNIYIYLRDDLSIDARNFWNHYPKAIKKGVIHSGSYENYMHLLRKVLHLLIGKKNIKKFFNTFDEKELEILYKKKWNNKRWRFFTSVLLSRKTMSLLFDKNFFRYVNGNFSFGNNFAQKTHNALTRMPLRNNYFLSYILLGNYYDENNLPPYLRPENYDIVKERLYRIKVVTASCEDFFRTLPDSYISKFNFTNIFEWMSEEQFADLLKSTYRVAQNHAVITYRNLLVPREHPKELNDFILSHKEIASALHRKDRSFIYDNYIVEEIIKEEKKCHTEAALHNHAKS